MINNRCMTDTLRNKQTPIENKVWNCQTHTRNTNQLHKSRDTLSAWALNWDVSEPKHIESHYRIKQDYMIDLRTGFSREKYAVAPKHHPNYQTERNYDQFQNWLSSIKWKLWSENVVRIDDSIDVSAEDSKDNSEEPNDSSNGLAFRYFLPVELIIYNENKNGSWCTRCIDYNHWQIK